MQKLVISNKWPALVVIGDPVTKEQAAEICIRTTCQWWGTNDKEWLAQVGAVMDMTVDENGLMYNMDSLNEVRDTYKLIDLGYLSNSRIMSAWIGGTKGWCNWDGNIFCNNYNIGKWPSVEGVAKDWKKIAEAFPYLKLKSQVFAKESSEEGNYPTVQFNVSDGKVEVMSPSDNLMNPVGADLEGFRLYLNGTNPHRERGLTIQQLAWACEVTKKSLAEKN